MNDLDLAIAAARAAAAIHASELGTDLDVTTKSSDIDLVTRVDTAAEEAIRALLARHRPDDAVLGEEAGQDGLASRRWIVDPLDGTLNYAHGFPYYCVSVALEVEGTVEVGVVLDSVHDELFAATRGGGATVNGAPMGVSSEPALRRSMLATGFAYSGAGQAENVAYFARMLPQAGALRRPGAAALDLANLAAGRLDGFWELYLNPWDVAAGLLLVEEAGGRTSDEEGQPYRLGHRFVVASNGWVHEALLDGLRAPVDHRNNTTSRK